MRFESFEDELGVAVAAADRLEAVIAARRDALVVLPAGRTPLRFFEELLRRVRARRLDLSKARFFQLDEYVGVGARERESFHALLRSQLLDPLGRAPERDALLDGSAKDPRAAIERHAARLAEAGGADVVFLGIGRNGHVAFNEPGTPADAPARVTELAAETRRQAEAELGRGRAPHRGITLGLREIRASRRIVLLATGAAKAGIVAALFEEPASPLRPASLLLDHADFTILADKAAAAGLREDGSVSITAAGRRRSGATLRR